MRRFAYPSSRQPTSIRRDLLHFLTHWFTSYKKPGNDVSTRVRTEGDSSGPKTSFEQQQQQQQQQQAGAPRPLANLHKIGVMMTSRLLRHPRMIEQIILQGSHRKTKDTITQEKIMAALP